MLDSHLDATVLGLLAQSQHSYITPMFQMIKINATCMCFIILFCSFDTTSGEIVIGSAHKNNGPMFASSRSSQGNGDAGEINHRVFTIPRNYIPSFESNQDVIFYLFDYSKAIGKVLYIIFCIYSADLIIYYAEIVLGELCSPARTIQRHLDRLYNIP